eukprot:2510150-Rhodomonas_salina.1
MLGTDVPCLPPQPSRGRYGPGLLMPAPLSGSRPILSVTILLTTATIYFVASRCPLSPPLRSLALSLSLSPPLLLSSS